jgi:hypothetical protein
MYLSVQWTVSSDKSSVDIASSVLTPVNQSHRHVFEPGKTLKRVFFRCDTIKFCRLLTAPVSRYISIILERFGRHSFITLLRYCHSTAFNTMVESRRRVTE